MDPLHSTQFVTSLARYLQHYSSGCLQFDKYVLVTGHLVVSIDAKENIEYVINEKICKSGDMVNYLSNSFPTDSTTYDNQPTYKDSEQTELEVESKPDLIYESCGTDFKSVDFILPQSSKVSADISHLSNKNTIDEIVNSTTLGKETSSGDQDYTYSATNCNRSPPRLNADFSSCTSVIKEENEMHALDHETLIDSQDSKTIKDQEDGQGFNVLQKKTDKRRKLPKIKISLPTALKEEIKDRRIPEKKKKKRVYIKKFKCESCDKAFWKPSDLLVHYRYHTGEKPYTCDVCGKSFAEKHVLKQHRFTHSGEKPYVCDICGAGFNQKGNLKIHKRCHSGDKPFVCELCGKGFAQAGNLRIHYTIHGDEKPFKCEICNTAYNTPQSLRRHKKIHTGEKPAKCEQCGKAFACTSYLKKHLLTHTDEKPHVCDFCGLAFARKDHLNTHKKRHRN